MNVKTQKRKSKTNKLLIPIILIIGFVPMIVHSYYYNTNLAQFDWFPNSTNEQTDLYFWWKMTAIIIIGVAMIAIMFYQYRKKVNFLFDNSFYALMLYALFVMMSALFSNYKYWVVRGTYELFEPVWVVLIYLVLCYYTYNFVQEENQIDFILLWSGIGIAIVTFIGFFQYLGLNVMKTTIGKCLVLSPSLWGDMDGLSFAFADRTVYTTLYNPNFLSFYFGMLIPFLICLFIGTKKVWQRVIICIAEVLCIICLTGSASSSGWMALAIAGVIAVLILLSRRKKWFTAGIIVTVIGLISSVIFCNTTDIGHLVKDTIVGTYYAENQYSLQSIDTMDQYIKFMINGNPLYVSYEVDSEGVITITCTDADQNLLGTTEIDQEKQISAVNDERFSNVQVQPINFTGEIPGISVYVDGISWNFTKTETNKYAYMNSAGKMVDFPNIKPSRLFKDDAMSNRGRIWDNTIPLLGKHIIMGAGANTYLFEYPQEDYIGQAYIYGFNSYGVKAHCWYLQQWVETGLVGTLSLIVFLLWYLIKSIRIYRRVNLHSRLSWIGFGIFTAVLVYMLVGLVNDSNVCTAPVFWCMLGLGLSVNHMLIKNENLFVKASAEIQTNAITNERNNLDKKETISSNPISKKTTTKKMSRKQRKSGKK